MRERLTQWMAENLHDAVIRLSEISGPGSLAFFLDDTPPPTGAVHALWATQHHQQWR